MNSAFAVLVPIVLMASLVGTNVGYGQTNTNTVNNNQSQTATAIGGGSANSNADSSSVSEGGAAFAEGGSSVSYSNSISEGGSGVGWSSSVSEGGVGWSDSDSVASVSINTTSISNIKNRVPPMTTYPPYLPLWQHGGWGTIQAYFPNGPTNHDSVYERTFDPSNPEDMRDLRRMLVAQSFNGPLEVLGGVLNGLGTLFGGADRYHRGRGFEITNGLFHRERRPKGKPLYVFIDNSVDADLLEKEGYNYEGRLSLEGTTDRNWDLLYAAAVAEALPWDIDILLISGGMKGVTVGHTTSLSGASGYSQTNYSLSMFGGRSKGVTEGKGEPVLSASAYRFCPELLQRRRIPRSLYDRIRLRPKSAPVAVAPARAPAAPAQGLVPEEQATREPQDRAAFSGPVDYVTVK